MRQAGWILMATLLTSNILGFIRDRLMAQKLPAYLTDIYFNAFRLPDFIFTVFILGTVTTAFLPIFTKLQERSGQEAANRLANQVLASFAWLLLILTAILYLAMPQLAPLISPFAEADRQQLLIQASRLLLIQPVIFSLSYLVGSILNARKYFLANSLAPLVYNLTIIFFIYFGADRFGLAAIIYGVLAGAILHLAIQLPSLLASGFRLLWPLTTNSDSVSSIKEIVALAWPRTLQLLLGQLVILYFARLAAGLPAGSVAALTYADNIQTVPTVIFGNSLALASFPYLAEAAVKNDLTQFAEALTRAWRRIIFLLAPAAVGIYILRYKIVSLLLGVGHFDQLQTLYTAESLGAFAIGLIAVGSLPLLIRAAFALEASRQVLLTAIPSTILTLGLAYSWHSQGLGYGPSSLALAASYGACLQLVLLITALIPRLGWLWLRQLITPVGKYALMSLLMALILVLIELFWPSSWFNLSPSLELLVQLISSITLGAASYLILALLFRQPEVTDLWKDRRIFIKS